MHFAALRLREWKAYRRADLEFPVGLEQRSVVLVGARNGFGKTSILEAIIICLYGAKGRDLVARADDRDADTGRLPGYRAFIERAFNLQAFEEGESRMAVEIEVVDGRRKITIERAWHVRNVDGRPYFKTSDEELRIYEGEDDDQRPLGIPPGANRLEHLEAFIEETFLERTLAQFFLFDGERVQQLAKSELAVQVRQGIEGLLGVDLLRKLETDLETLVANKKAKADEWTGSSELELLHAEIVELRVEVRALAEDVQSTSGQIAEARADRERLTREQLMLSGDGLKDAAELNEKRAIQQREVERCRDELAQIQERQLPLAMVGTTLRKQLGEQILAEQAFRTWEGAVQSGDTLLEKFLARLVRDQLGVNPELSMSQKLDLTKWVQKVWSDLHHPPPSSCAEEPIHGYLNDEELRSVAARLKDVDQFAAESVAAILGRLASAYDELSRIKDQLARIAGSGGRVNDLQARIEALFEKEKTLNTTHVILANAHTAKAQTLANKEQALQRARDMHTKAAPQQAMVRRAAAIKNMLGELIQGAVGLFTKKIGVEMTRAYCGIAHKGTVKEVRVNPDCTVELLTQNGTNFRLLDNSAGENQVFACALIAAVVSASGRNFPIVVDTPLARLDQVHRERLLAWLAEHTTTQVILLSTDAEVVDRALEVVRPFVTRTFLVEHEQLSEDFGLSTVMPDRYFQPIDRVTGPGTIMAGLPV
jgi:DNA sulfur modification protein DndD